MNDWRSGLMLRTFMRLALRTPLVIALIGGFLWVNFTLWDHWLSLFQSFGGQPDTPTGRIFILATIFVVGATLVILTIAMMRRPLWERHAVGLLGLVRGATFGMLVLLVCLIIAAALIGGALWAAPLGETPRAFTFLHRSSLIAILLLCTSPGLFALVVSVRERQGYSTIARIWRIDRAQTIRGVFLIMVLTTCVAGVAIVGASISVRGVQVATLWLGLEINWITSMDLAERAIVTAIFATIAFTTAHVVQYERIRDWESGGDVTGVFD